LVARMKERLKERAQKAGRTDAQINAHINFPRIALRPQPLKRQPKQVSREQAQQKKGAKQQPTARGKKQQSTLPTCHVCCAADAFYVSTKHAPSDCPPVPVCSTVCEGAYVQSCGCDVVVTRGAQALKQQRGIGKTANEKSEAANPKQPKNAPSRKRQLAFSKDGHGDSSTDSSSFGGGQPKKLKKPNVAGEGLGWVDAEVEFSGVMYVTQVRQNAPSGFIARWHVKGVRTTSCHSAEEVRLLVQ
jgi:hypothetical protein